MQEPSLEKGYSPREVEERWYAFWEKHGVFEAKDDLEDKRPVYVVPMPPPNVTGSLHMGHALTCALEDTLVRYHRMRGYNTLWQPGIDHAGIATQTVVERNLAREGKTRHELGRTAFVERVWQWKAESGGRIALQQRVLGASPDWKRSKFTMDEDMSRAVTHAFVALHKAGLMYRATRLINWCPECQTALSDLEVENEEGASGELFEFAYQIENSDREIVVATTRPETMLGDTAIAVHPDDPRYKDLLGRRAKHPFSERTIPIVGDAILVDPKFGTGAVKVTPAHDFNDFQTGKRHGLEEINIFNKDGTVNENGGTFGGLDRKRARTAVKKALADLGLARGTKPHTLTLPKCQRSGGVVEPMISTQWFLKMKEMADQALSAVKEGRTQILPEEWTKTYNHFLENIQDWCVSRQLWWGHQIPAWHGPNGEIRVAETRPTECGEGWVQDPDVLDTWFSSALWPFSTLGWPDRTPALAKFYPASDLETGYDILFFWVARMMMFGLHFMGDVPFRRILLHGLVVDETGEKMSKVKGNVIDPLDLVHGTTFSEMVKKTLPGASEEEALLKFRKAYPSAAQMGAGFPAYGSDAVRFTLVTYPPSNKRIALTLKRIEGNRHFLNKIWNASRLVLDLVGSPAFQDPRELAPSEAPEERFNAWILSRLASTTLAADAGLSSFRIDEAAQAGYHFFWDDLCDWYLELAKPILREEGVNPVLKERTKTTLLFALEASLRLLHPVLPFVTEEIWQRLPRPSSRRASIAFGPFPTEDKLTPSPLVEEEVRLFQSVVTAARTLRSEHEIHPASEVALLVRSEHAPSRDLLASLHGSFKTLAKAKATRFESLTASREKGMSVSAIATAHGPVEVLVDLRGHVTADRERERIARELRRVEKEMALVEKKLLSKGFVDRAPPEVVEETKKQKSTLEETRTRLTEAHARADELS